MSAHPHLQLSPQGFLFDHRTGTSYSTNRVGAFILDLVIQGETQDRILEQLVREYDVSQDRARQDMDEFLGLAGSFRLLPAKRLEEK